MRGDPIPGRSAPANPASQAQRDFERIREKVEKLTGERGDATKSLSAIRRGELAGLEIHSQQITAAPTQADFNALQTDVAALFELLVRISNTLGTATIPKVL